MQNGWCVFSGNGRKPNNFLGAIALGLSLWIGSAHAAEPLPITTPQDISTLPEASVRALSKNSAGNQVQLGDRIPLVIEIKPEWIKGEPQFSLNVPDGSQKLTELGWYLDQNTLWVAGSLRIIVAPLKEGRQTLPTLVIKSKDQNFVAIARTQPFTVTVIALEKKAEQKPELLDPMNIPLPTKFIVLGIAILFALAAFGVWLLKKLKKAPVTATKTPPVKVEEPEHTVAIKRLETLFQNNPYGLEAGKPVAFGVSEILKDFFSARFKVDASESTSAEMLGLLRSVGMGPNELLEISELFDELDQIKFVKREHLGAYTSNTYSRHKLKSLAIVHRWARQITSAQLRPNTPAGGAR
ncbi:MAG: hypothetical protein JST80_07870 [Bdellovibrionales bacterium]|nr:hypothetical protein [Bdellovibrionales bacterium]